ncbi:unnamed protein product, partial [Didymodactylos carnosus]
MYARWYQEDPAHWGIVSVSRNNNSLIFDLTIFHSLAKSSGDFAFPEGAIFAICGKTTAFGRVYIAHEGINAQMSVPEQNFSDFVTLLNTYQEFKGVDIKVAVEDDGKSFYKLAIKVRNKIVADGINDSSFNPADTGEYLTSQKFNDYLESTDTIVVDMRNHYESEVGRFKNAYCPDADTFREELVQSLEFLTGQEDKNIIMYCTGGIRCEKASSYFKHKGFKNVYSLKGGIIQYANDVKKYNLENKFIGKNFVFDERVGERITDDIIANCHQCDKPSDRHMNCRNDDCHLLFIQCEMCEQAMSGCCTLRCQQIAALPIEEQRKLRKNRYKSPTETLSVYKSRLRPNLRDLIKERVEN